jgi:hypothetical protein
MGRSSQDETRVAPVTLALPPPLKPAKNPPPPSARGKSRKTGARGVFKQNSNLRLRAGAPGWAAGSS